MQLRGGLPPHPNPTSRERETLAEAIRQSGFGRDETYWARKIDSIRLEGRYPDPWLIIQCYLIPEGRDATFRFHLWDEGFFYKERLGWADGDEAASLALVNVLEPSRRVQPVRARSVGMPRCPILPPRLLF